MLSYSTRSNLNKGIHMEPNQTKPDTTNQNQNDPRSKQQGTDDSRTSGNKTTAPGDRNDGAKQGPDSRGAQAGKNNASNPNNTEIPDLSKDDQQNSQRNTQNQTKQNTPTGKQH
jgi:hypothetical protein